MSTLTKFFLIIVVIIVLIAGVSLLSWDISPATQEVEENILLDNNKD